MERENGTPLYDAFDPEKEIFTELNEIKEFSTGERIKRMFTVFPYRDAMWLVGIMFILGSLSFTTNAFFTLLPLLSPEAPFGPETTLAVPITVFIGAGLFVVAGVLEILAASNADQGFVELTENEKGGQSLKHRPALIGSKNWRWVPSKVVFLNLICGNRPFQASVMQLIGVFMFTVSAMAALSGLVDATHPLFPILVLGFQLIGGSLFFFANLLLLLANEQDRWWKPKPRSVGWHAALQNTIGGAGFALTGLFGLQNAILEGAVATFVGSWTFLFGSTLTLYITMEYC